MKGARPFTEEEVERVSKELGSLRDKALWMLGVKSGLRISELLSLKIQDVMEHGQVGSCVTVSKKNTKGKVESRNIPLTGSAKEALKEYLQSIQFTLDQPLFKSNKSDQAITRMQAHRILKNAFNGLRLQGKCATHSMRKTYAHKVHKALGGKIEMTQIAMGHKSLSSTAKYIQVNREEVEKAILSQG